MPNHFHGIVSLPSEAGTLPQVLGALIAGFKASVTSRARRELALVGPVWHRNYHEHVVRNRNDLARIREYIINNPGVWEQDRYFLPA